MFKRIISAAAALAVAFGAAAYLPEGFAAQSTIMARAEETDENVFTDGKLTYRIHYVYNFEEDDVFGESIECLSVTDCDESLTSVVIPSSFNNYEVKYIAYDAFANCINLNNIVFPNTIDDIGTFSSQYNKIEDTAWFKNQKDCIVYLGSLAYTYVGKTPSNNVLTFKDGTKKIQDYGFHGYFDSNSDFIKNVKIINIPDSVTTIGYGAFGETSLEVINIGSGFKFNRQIFGLKSDLLLKVNISNNNPYNSSEDGVVYNKDKTSLVYCPYGIEECNISNSVTDIQYDAFLNCKKLKSITIPKNVKSIGSHALGYTNFASTSYELIPDFYIYCYSGTAGEQYAKDNNIPYELIDAPAQTHTHTYTTKVVAPTYTTQGYTLHTCSVCGDSYKDNYTAKLTRTSIAKATVGGISAKTYTGKAIKPAPTVKLSGKTLKSGTDYTVSYKNNKSVGKATVTITGKGVYTGTVSKTFKINPKATSISKLTSPKAKQLKATYKKVSGVTGYQVTYSTSKKFTKSTTKTATVKTTSKTVKSLKKGKTYYVKVRAYKTVGGVKYYSSYSAVKKVKVK